jgi:hypothetical protein
MGGEHGAFLPEGHVGEVLAGKEDRPFRAEHLIIARGARRVSEISPAVPTPSDQGVSAQATVTGLVSSPTGRGAGAPRTGGRFRIAPGEKKR